MWAAARLCARRGEASLGCGGGVRLEGRGCHLRAAAPAARPPRPDRARCPGLLAAHTLGGRDRGVGRVRARPPGRGEVGFSPPPAPGRVREARVSCPPAAGGPGEEKRNFSALLRAVSRPSAARGGVVVAGGGGGRHVGVCEKRGAPRPLPSCWGQPAVCRSGSRSRQDAAAAGLEGRRKGQRQFVAGSRGGGRADTPREPRGRVRMCGA